MIRQLSHIKYLQFFLFILAFALYSSNIGGVSIYILDEAKNAGCASEMFQHETLVVPTFNDVLRTDKPPLHYFFMMLSFRIFGINPFAARFFSALFGACTVLITYLFSRKFDGKETAIWTSLVMLATIHLSIQFHLAVPDPYLIFFFVAGVMSFFAAIKEKRPIYLLFMYISIGLGTLAKGPVAIALSGLIFFLFLIFSKRFSWSEIRALKPFTGALIVLLVALPWYILVHQQTNGVWTEGFFLRQNLERFTSKLEGHGGIFLITFGYVLAGMFPFSVFFGKTAIKTWKDRKDDLTLFLMITALTIIIFFSLSRTKLPNYTVPAYPFLSILVARYLMQTKAAKLKAGMIILLTISIIIIPALLIALKASASFKEVSYVAWYFVPFTILLIISFSLWLKNNKEAALISVSGSGIIVSLIFFCLAFPPIDRKNPVTESLPLLKGKEIRYFEKFNPAYPFSLQKIIPSINENEFETFFQKYPDGIIISLDKNIKKLKLPDNLEISFSVRNTFDDRNTVLISKKEQNSKVR